MCRVQRTIPVGKWGVIENVQMNSAGENYRTRCYIRLPAKYIKQVK